MNPKISYIRINRAILELIVFRVVEELMSYDEPLPPFDTGDDNKIESCLNQPFLTIDNQELYPGVYSKAAAFFYFFCKNHPFVNGNKRVAVVTSLVFSFLNGREIIIPNNDLYLLAINVAKSSQEPNEQIKHIANLYKENSREAVIKDLQRD